MRSLFLEYLFDALFTAGIGIEYSCLSHLHAHIELVLRENAVDLQDRSHFARAYEEFQEFVARMLEDAREKDYSSLHEDTFFAAKDRCGLIFWCG